MISRCVRWLACSVFLGGLTSACIEAEPFDDRFDLPGSSPSDVPEDDDGGESVADDGGEGEDPALGPVPDVPPGEPPRAGEPEDPSGGACVEFGNVLAPVPPSVLFVLDRSGSMMAAGFDSDDPAKSRWTALHEAVSAVVLADVFDASIEFGAKTFSSHGWGECGVSPELDVNFAVGDSVGFLAGIPGPNTQVNGGTPTHAALAVTLDQMRSYEAEGSKVIVLVTDGSIGCTDDAAATLAEIVDDLTIAREIDGIATYVVGIAPQYNSTIAQLQAMAAAGGTEQYFDAGDAAGLTNALADVVAASYANSCLLAFDEAPSAPELTVVEVDGQSWPEIADCEDGDGWVWTDSSLTHMRLCNAACDALLATHEVNVEYHCEAG